MARRALAAALVVLALALRSDAATQLMTCSSGTGSVWVNPGNVTADDANYASFNATTRDVLSITNCTPTLPLGATVTGFQVRYIGCGTGGTTAQRQIELNLLNVGTCTAKTAVDQIGCGAWTDSTVGTAGDTWSCSNPNLTAVNSTAFGVALRDNNTSAQELREQFVSITVYYTPLANCGAGESACQVGVAAACACGTDVCAAGEWCAAAGNACPTTQAACLGFLPTTTTVTTTTTTTTSTTTTTVTTTTVVTTTTTTTLVPWALNIGGGLLASFDVVDDQTSTATDLLDLTTFEVAGDDTKVRAAECSANSFRCRNSLNGGDSASRFAGWLDLTAGQRGGWGKSNAQLLSTATGMQCVALHQPATGGVSGDRVIARWLEADGSPGCEVVLGSGDDLKLRYNGTPIATASATVPTNTCTDDPMRGCVSGPTDCANGLACGTCSTTTGQYCYWPTVCLGQQTLVQALNRVQCSLYVNGSLEAGGDYQDAPTADLLTSFEFGGVGGEAATAQLAFDDFGMSNNLADHNLFFLHWYYPLSAQPSGATEDTCGTDGGGFARCINDYGIFGLNTYRLATTPLDDSLRLNAGKSVDVTRFTPTLTAIPAGATVPVVQVDVIARTTSTSGTYTMRGRIAACPSDRTVCTNYGPSVDLSLAPDTAVLWRMAPRLDKSPAGGATTWTVDALKQFGFFFGNVSTSPSWIRLNALGAVAKVDRGSSEPIIQYLHDHNLGTNDGQTVFAFTGDSTYCGTGSAQCRGGTTPGANCNQQTHCKWDPNHSKPAGGCSSDAECRSCTNRRLEFNAGAGVPCTATAACNLGTCTAGLCTGGDGDVSCNVVQPQCIAAGNPSACCTGGGTGNCDCDLGTCPDAVDATCDDSCPDGAGNIGTCPARAGAPNETHITADLVLNCCQDGTTLPGGRAFLNKALYGRSETCFRAYGSLTGRCECSTASECQDISGGVCSFAAGNGRCKNAVYQTCTTDADCTPVSGGTCLGVCTGSDNGREACTGQTVIGSNPVEYQCKVVTLVPSPDFRRCTFPPLDYAGEGHGLNDLQGLDDPECRDPFLEVSSGPGAACDNCAQAECGSHAEAVTARSGTADAQCFGALADGTGGCLTKLGGGIACTTRTKRCATTVDCLLTAPEGPTPGLVCTGYTGGVQQDGLCTCTTNADCPSNAFATFVCGADNLCVQQCATDPDCGTGGHCVSGKCRGRATCPCDMFACTVDADCPAHGIVGFFSLLPSYPFTATCNTGTGKCSQCGQTACASSPSQRAFQSNYLKHVFPWIRGYQRTIKADFAAEAARVNDVDGAPLLMPISFPTGTSDYYPVCKGGLWVGAGVVSKRVALQYAAEWKHSMDVRPAVENLPDALIYADVIHPNTFPGAVTWAQGMTEYVETLNSCRTGTGPASKLARYCRQPNGTWLTTTCAIDNDCTGADRCTHRICTVDDDTNTNNGGCPGAPTCNVE